VQDDATIEQLKAILVANERVQLAVLFGSFAQGRIGPGSDIDVGIAFESLLSIDERLDLAQSISRQLKREVDIVDLRVASGVLLQQILNHRKTLVKRDTELLGSLIAKRIVEEWDFMPLLDRMLLKRQERFAGGTKSS
jgi:uncharacterized protein